MSIYDEAVLIQKPSGYKAEKLYNVVPSPEVSEQSSLEFDGVDDCLITDGDSVAQPTTYSFWCKSSETSNNEGVFGHGGYSKGAFHFNYDGTRPLLYLGSSYYRYWVDNSAQDDGEWHHWVVYSDTNDITNSKLYVDGVLQTASTTLTTGSLNAYTEGLTIGSDQQSGGYYFGGSISDFAVFSSELSAADVTEIYNYGSPNDLLLPASYGTDISQSSTKSVEFDGVDDYLQVSNFNNLGTSDASFSFWVNCSDFTNVTFLAKFQDNSNRILFIADGTGQFMAQGRIGGSYAWNTTMGSLIPFENEWINLIVTINRSANLTLYLNGVSFAATNISSTSSTNVDNTGDWFFGAYGGGSYFNGSIDNIGIYDKALTQAEITRQYNGGQPIDLSTDATSDSLVAYYQMGDGTLDDYPLIADQTDATLGSELVINGDFSNGLTGWNAPTQDGAYQQDTGSGMKMYSGSAVGASNALSTSGTLNIAGIEGKTYQLDITASDFIGMTNCTIRLNGAYDANNIISFVDGTQTIYFVAYTNFTYIKFVAASFEDGVTVNSISIKQVQGNPATMTNMSSSDITTDVALSVVNDLDLYYQMGDGILDSYPLIADQTNATLGSEMVTNGDFSNGSTGWTIEAPWSIGSGVASYDELSSNNIRRTDCPIVLGNTYRVEFEILNCTGSAHLSIYDASSGTLYIGNENWGNGSYVRYFTASVSSTGISIWGNTAGDAFDLDNISIKQVQGNPAMMTNMSSADIVAWTPNIETDFDVARSSTTTRRNASGYIEQVAANVPRLNYDSGDSCPYLLTEAASTNLITYPISFGNSYWTKSGASIEGDLVATNTNTELITDGDFVLTGTQSASTTGTYWTTGSSWTIGSGVASYDAVNNLNALAQLFTFGIDKRYYIQFEVVSGTARIGFNSNVGGVLFQEGANLKNYTVGTHSFYATAVSTNPLSIYAYNISGGTAFTIDNISVKEVQGFEAPKEIPVANGAELVTNGTFDTDTGWTKGVGWSIGGGVAVAASITGDLQQSSAIGFVTGKMYQVTYDVVSVTSGSIFFKQSAYSGVKRGAVGTYTETYTALGTSIFVLRSDNSFSGTIDNVSIKEVTSYSGGGFEREAYKLVESSAGGSHYVIKSPITVTSGATVTLSTYAKAGERNWLLLYEGYYAGGYFFNLTDGTIGSVRGNTPDAYSITTMANGWYRCSITVTVSSTNVEYIRYLANADGTYNYTGSGKGLYIFGAQLEENDYASSLMLPTTEGSTTSRVGDSIENAGNQSLFSSVNSSGVLYAEIAANSDDLTTRYISLCSDGSDENRVSIYYSSLTNYIYGVVRIGDVSKATILYQVSDITDLHKIAVRWNSDGAQLYIDGASVGTPSVLDCSYPTSTLEVIHYHKGNTANKFYGKTKALAVFDYLSDDQMVKLTEEGYNTFNALATANNFIIR